MKRHLRTYYYKMAYLCNMNRCLKLGLGLIGILFYCEFMIYYVTLLRCSWPQLSGKNIDLKFNTARGNEPLKIMVLADTHLLGYRQGHWFDKLRREWQMYRSFQSTMLMHSPDLVFVLGDLFDEGKWADDAEFKEHLRRFKSMFRPPSDSSLEVVVGNHDIGFHYSANPHKLSRFERGFGTKAVKLLTMKDNLFVLINSMALEGDRCTMCLEARRDLKKISKILSCSRKLSTATNCTESDRMPYSRPIVLQHFPLYRQSDADCETPDQAPPSEKYARFREKWECLSKSATNELLRLLDPRLVLSAHTHHGCYTVHKTTDGDEKRAVPEWTVASFSWRNKPQPTFLLMVLSNSDYSISQCSLPHEDTVIYLYLLAVPVLLLWFLAPLYCRAGACQSRKLH